MTMTLLKQPAMTDPFPGIAPLVCAQIKGPRNHHPPAAIITTADRFVEHANACVIAADQPKP